MLSARKPASERPKPRELSLTNRISATETTRPMMAGHREAVLAEDAREK